MKVRSNFVTNSSSSSFTIRKRHLDDEQIEAIRRHGEIGKLLGMSCSNEPWDIEENSRYIGGYTSMDNFDMEEFLAQIDVNLKYVHWSDPLWFELPEDCSWRDLL